MKTLAMQPGRITVRRRLRTSTILAMAFVLELGWAVFAAAHWGLGVRSRAPAPGAVLHAYVWLGGIVALAAGAGVLAWRGAPRDPGGR